MGHTIKKLADKTVLMIRRAMWKLGVFEHKTLFKIFDSLVAPILCYGSEVWGYEYQRKTEHQNQSWELESMPQTQPYLVNVADCQWLQGTI